MKLLFLVVSLSFVFGCQNIKFEKDLGMISSASANSPEYFAYVGDRPCKDMDGIIGMCSKRLKRNQDFVLRVPPREYSYRAYWDCTNSVQGQPLVVTVPEKADYKFEVKAGAYGAERTFTCTLLATPLDRPEPIAAFTKVTVNLIDEDYQLLDAPYPHQSGFVFGQYGYYVMYLTDDGWHYATEMTQLKKVKVYQSYVESYVMRGSSYGL